MKESRKRALSPSSSPSSLLMTRCFFVKATRHEQAWVRKKEKKSLYSHSLSHGRPLKKRPAQNVLEFSSFCGSKMVIFLLYHARRPFVYSAPLEGRKIYFHSPRGNDRLWKTLFLLLLKAIWRPSKTFLSSSSSSFIYLKKKSASLRTIFLVLRDVQHSSSFPFMFAHLGRSIHFLLSEWHPLLLLLHFWNTRRVLFHQRRRIFLFLPEMFFFLAPSLTHNPQSIVSLSPHLKEAPLFFMSAKNVGAFETSPKTEEE